MQYFKIILLVLLNTPNRPTQAGKIWVPDNNETRLPKDVQLRMRKAVDSTEALDALLKFKLSELSKHATEEFLSETLEQIDSSSLLKLLAKLKEEFSGETKKLDAGEVKSSLDKLTANLESLSKLPRHSKSEPAAILGQLSEEVLDDEGRIFTGEFYSDDEYVEEEEEDSSDASLLALQKWNTQGFI